MSGKKRRTFAASFKLRVIERMEAGESAATLSRELNIRRNLLSDWHRQWREKGAAGVRRAGRPTLSDELTALGGPPDDLASAERRIAELQRKVGEQSLLIDFFKGALRRIEASRQAKEEPGATASSPRSKR